MVGKTGEDRGRTRSKRLQEMKIIAKPKRKYEVTVNIEFDDGTPMYSQVIMCEGYSMDSAMDSVPDRDEDESLGLSKSAAKLMTLSVRRI